MTVSAIVAVAVTVVVLVRVAEAVAVAVLPLVLWFCYPRNYFITCTSFATAVHLRPPRLCSA